jgi:hypothetical protein
MIGDEEVAFATETLLVLEAHNARTKRTLHVADFINIAPTFSMRTPLGLR